MPGRKTCTPRSLAKWETLSDRFNRLRLIAKDGHTVQQRARFGLKLITYTDALEFIRWIRRFDLLFDVDKCRQL